MELWLREKAFRFANVIMRVPPLFVIDELLRISMGVPQESIIYNSTDYGFKIMDTSDGLTESLLNSAGNSVLTSQNWSVYNLQSPYAIYSYQMYLMTALKFLASCFGCVAAICCFMLWTKHLLIVYRYLIKVGVVFLSCWLNIRMMDDIVTYINSKEGGGSIAADILNLQFKQLISNGPGLMIIQNYISQIILGGVFCFIDLGIKYPLLQKIQTWSFRMPSLLGIYPLPTDYMIPLCLIAALVPLGECKFILWYNSFNIRKTLFRGYKLGRAFITTYGLTALTEAQWTRLKVPSVLRTFWIIRVAEQVIQIMSRDYGHDDFTFFSMIKTLMVNGCETLTAVLGMTSIISVICHYIGSFFHWILLIEDEDEKSIGSVSAMLFYILALQSGLTSLDKDNRLLRLCRNLCLLFTAVLLFVHNIVNPLLMSLSASHNPALHRHLRALGVCVFLIVFPAWLLTFLWSHYTISTWLLAVTVFSIEVIVKVIVSIAIYLLFLYDAYRKNFWDELDDYVYIIRSFGNSVEFGFGIILFFNGFWILVFEAGGAIRAFLMCVHAYFNLWCEAKAGWSVFMKRRHAVNKINLLPEATPQQISEHADVCAICYQEMETARITKCNHYFHGVCLRKWLYVQDKCPLCNEIMYKVNNPSPEEAGAAAPENQEVPQERLSDGSHREEANAIINGPIQIGRALYDRGANPVQEQVVEER